MYSDHRTYPLPIVAVLQPHKAQESKDIPSNKVAQAGVSDTCHFSQESVPQLSNTSKNKQWLQCSISGYKF